MSYCITHKIGHYLESD